MILGALQAIIVTVGDLVIGVQCVSPLLFVLGGIAISFTYVNIIYALSTTFKHIGKAIGVILVIVQIPGSSGMYPIEMMPGFFPVSYTHLDVYKRQEIASLTDGTLFVVREDFTKREEALNAIGQLKKSEKVKLIGTVMNYCETETSEYYYSYYTKDGKKVKKGSDDQGTSKKGIFTNRANV